MMGQWWVGPHFELDYFGVTILGPLDINLPSGFQRQAMGCLGSLCPSSLCSHMEHLSLHYEFGSFRRVSCG